MANLTDIQAAELAKNFLGLAQAFGNYRFVNWKKLSKTQCEVNKILIILLN
jgi:hypothetical protein